jgi:hypothetical protein
MASQASDLETGKLTSQGNQRSIADAKPEKRKVVFTRPPVELGLVPAVWVSPQAMPIRKGISELDCSLTDLNRVRQTVISSNGPRKYV